MKAEKEYGTGKGLKLAAWVIACAFSGVGSYAETTVTFELLGDLPGGHIVSRAYAASADGTVVVGNCVSSSGDLEAFRWEDGTMTGLGDLPGGQFGSSAFAVSADGTVVVGSGTSANGCKPVFWSEDNGWKPVSLNDLLDSAGVDRNGFVLTEARAMSSDGTTIVGEGLHTNGASEAFRVRILFLDPLIGGTPVAGDDGWYFSEWFRYYNTDHAPWIYHAQHGFIYCDPSSTNESMFIYDDAMVVWCWTSQDLYPFLYAFDPPADIGGTDVGSCWLFYFEGSEEPRSYSVVTGVDAGAFLYFGP